MARRSPSTTRERASPPVGIASTRRGPLQVTTRSARPMLWTTGSQSPEFIDQRGSRFLIKRSRGGSERLGWRNWFAEKRPKVGRMTALGWGSSNLEQQRARHAEHASYNSIKHDQPISLFVVSAKLNADKRRN